MEGLLCLMRLITLGDELMTAYAGDSEVKMATSLESLIKQLDRKERLIAD